MSWLSYSHLNTSKMRCRLTDRQTDRQTDRLLYFIKQDFVTKNQVGFGIPVWSSIKGFSWTVHLLSLQHSSPGDKWPQLIGKWAVQTLHHSISGCMWILAPPRTPSHLFFMRRKIRNIITPSTNAPSPSCAQYSFWTLPMLLVEERTILSLVESQDDGADTEQGILGSVINDVDSLPVLANVICQQPGQWWWQQ